jgi:hypothetical protein
MLRFVETREQAYGVDLDYVLDFIDYCNKGKAAMGCWSVMADKWISKDPEIKVSAEELAQAALKFVKEQGTRNI